MLLLVVHYSFAVLACICAIGFIGFAAAAQQYLDPGRSLDEKLTTWFTPNRRATDFIEPGWRYQKLQWLAGVLAVVAAILFGITGTHGVAPAAVRGARLSSPLPMLQRLVAVRAPANRQVELTSSIAGRYAAARASSLRRGTPLPAFAGCRLTRYT